jgi:hypothetical protein
MAKGIYKLSSAQAKAATDAGRYSDGGGLELGQNKLFNSLVLIERLW